MFDSGAKTQGLWLRTQDLGFRRVLEFRAFRVLSFLGDEDFVSWKPRLQGGVAQSLRVPAVG